MRFAARFRALGRRGGAMAVGAAVVISAVPAALAATRQVSGRGRADAARPGVAASCSTADRAYASLAARMTRDIQARIAARPYSIEGLEVSDSLTGITCWYHPGWHFYAASAIKATILATLLRKAQEQHRSLTARERYLATLMITQSDNGAASALWNELGIWYIQHFLNLAGMAQTRLAYAWGLSLLTAGDEARLLRLLAFPNPVLTTSSRDYELGLMARVISWQRWGTPAGAPASMITHVKNG